MSERSCHNDSRASVYSSVEKYQEASNRHDIEACITMFTDYGIIEFGGEPYAGVAVLRAADKYNEGSHTLEFQDFEMEGDLVRCTFWNAHELSRVLGTNGMTMKAEFTIKAKHNYKFCALPAEESERKRVADKAAPAITRLRENHPEVMEKWKGLDRPADEAVSALAELWRQHQ